MTFLLAPLPTPPAAANATGAGVSEPSGRTIAANSVTTAETFGDASSNNTRSNNTPSFADQLDRALAQNATLQTPASPQETSVSRVVLQSITIANVDHSTATNALSPKGSPEAPVATVAPSTLVATSTQTPSTVPSLVPAPASTSVLHNSETVNAVRHAPEAPEQAAQSPTNTLTSAETTRPNAPSDRSQPETPPVFFSRPNPRPETVAQESASDLSQASLPIGGQEPLELPRLQIATRPRPTSQPAAEGTASPATDIAVASPELPAAPDTETRDVNVLKAAPPGPTERLSSTIADGDDIPQTTGRPQNLEQKVPESRTVSRFSASSAALPDVGLNHSDASSRDLLPTVTDREVATVRDQVDTTAKPTSLERAVPVVVAADALSQSLVPNHNGLGEHERPAAVPFSVTSPLNVDVEPTPVTIPTSDVASHEITFVAQHATAPKSSTPVTLPADSTNTRPDVELPDVTASSIGRPSVGTPPVVRRPENAHDQSDEARPAFPTIPNSRREATNDVVSSPPVTPPGPSNTDDRPDVLPFPTLAQPTRPIDTADEAHPQTRPSDSLGLDAGDEPDGRFSIKSVGEALDTDPSTRPSSHTTETHRPTDRDGVTEHRTPAGGNALTPVAVVNAPESASEYSRPPVNEPSDVRASSSASSAPASQPNAAPSNTPSERPDIKPGTNAQPALTQRSSAKAPSKTVSRSEPASEPTAPSQALATPTHSSRPDSSSAQSPLAPSPPTLNPAGSVLSNVTATPISQSVASTQDAAPIHSTPLTSSALPNSEIVASQAASAVERAIETNINPLRIRLDPPELGSIAVEIQRDGGQLHIDIQFESTDALRAARDGVEELRQTLLAKGFDVEPDNIRLQLEIGRDVKAADTSTTAQDESSREQDASGRSFEDGRGRHDNASTADRDARRSSQHTRDQERATSQAEADKTVDEPNAARTRNRRPKSGAIDVTI